MPSPLWGPLNMRCRTIPKMAKIMEPILPILSILGDWAIILGSFEIQVGRMGY